MRRKNKKKANTQNTKQEERARLNQFKKNIFHYLKLLDVEEVAPLLGQSTYEVLYRMRAFNLPKLVLPKEIFMTDEDKKELYLSYESMMTDKTEQIYEGLKFSPKEMVTYLTLIDSGIKLKRDSSNAKVVRLVEKYLEKVPDFDVTLQQVFKQITVIMATLGSLMTRMTKSLCWFHLDEIKDDDVKSRFIIRLNEHIPEKQMMVIDHHPRPVYPLCLAFANAGPLEITIPAEKLNLPDSFTEKKIPVFLQSHLLHRMEERLDCLPGFICEFYLYHSLVNPKLIHFHGKILAEYLMDQKVKLGYILLEFHEDILLAKTFLLLSNHGTPEGEKLNEISGMKKFDHKYWSIDKLSTFQYSDLKDHPQTREMFENAGCGNLFEEVSFPEDFTGQTSSYQARQMLKYLEGVNEEEQEMTAVSLE